MFYYPDYRCKSLPRSCGLPEVSFEVVSRAGAFLGFPHKIVTLLFATLSPCCLSSITVCVTESYTYFHIGVLSEQNTLTSHSISLDSKYPQLKIVHLF